MNTVKAENEISKPRGSVFPKELRDLSNMVASFAKDFPFAEDKVDKLLKKMAAVQQADRIRESRAQADLDKLWAILRMLFRNKIELSIRKLPENGPDEQKNEDYRRMKEFLRRMGAKV